MARFLNVLIKEHNLIAKKIVDAANEPIHPVPTNEVRLREILANYDHYNADAIAYFDAIAGCFNGIAALNRYCK